MENDKNAHSLIALYIDNLSKNKVEIDNVTNRIIEQLDEIKTLPFWNIVFCCVFALLPLTAYFSSGTDVSDASIYVIFIVVISAFQFYYFKIVVPHEQSKLLKFRNKKNDVVKDKEYILASAKNNLKDHDYSIFIVIVSLT